MNKYFIEFVGTVTILFAKLLTEGEPTIMALVYFSMFSISKGITSGFFTPIGSLANFMIGRVTQEDFVYNIMTQIAATICVAITFIPIKVFMEKAQ